MADRENCRVCGAKRPADAPSGLCPACLLKAGLAKEKTAAYVPTGEQPGSIVAGRYKLLEQIGEGGMGEVWVADQLEPIKRRVALKLIKPGMDSRSVLGRFEAERQALAVMDHPNIAKVLDAGAAVDGRPYFVMELVKGTPITEFCDARRLTPKQRLELFVPVCQAIQHAHHKGIIHRDIKPSNVLVALHDETPVAKVIDFGVAKAVGQQLTEKTIYTGFGALVGTPAYMAPEQATFNQLDVDTRADVYALGVLLYELLAGSPPIEKERLKQAALDEVLRIVRDEEPPRPSQRLSTSQAKASIAATRQSDPARLSALMKGEIDWIVMKALEKDRTRRYDTANGLARDIQRYLAGDSVEACPPTLGYRLRKAYRKNRAAVRVASAFVMLLIAAVAVSTWLAVKARRAEAWAEDKRIEAEANAEEAKVNADAFWKASEANVFGRVDTEIKSLSLQVDLDLIECRTDPRVGLLRLARPMADTVGPVVTVMPGTNAEMKTTMSMDDRPEYRALREFVTAAVIATGQNYAPLLPPMSTDGLWVLSQQPSPDGKSLLTLSEDGTVRLWDIRTATQKHDVYREGLERVVQCGFSPDGKTIFTSDYDSIVRFWNVADTTLRAKTEFRAGRFVYPEGLSPSELSELASKANPVLISDRLALLRSQPHTLQSVSFNGAKNWNEGQNGPAELWDTTTGRLVTRLDRPGHEMSHYALAPDGRWFTAVEDGSQVVVFSAVDGKELSRLVHPSGRDVLSVQVSPHGRRIITKLWPNGPQEEPAVDSFQLWETDTWRCVPDKFINDLEEYWQAVQFLTDEVVYAFYGDAGGNTATKLYRLERPGSQLEGDGSNFTAHLGGQLLLGARDQIMDGRTLKRIPPPAGRRYPASLARLARDGRFVFAGCIIDTVTDKHFERDGFWFSWSLPENQPAFFPNLGSVAVSVVHGPSYARPETRILPVADRLDIPLELLQLWAQVTVRGELGPEGEFVPWDEQTWEKKRQELAAIPPPYPDLPFPGYVATDKLHWLRAEYEAAPEKDKLHWATKLLSRAEDAGDKAEATRWRAVLAPKASPAEPTPPE